MKVIILIDQILDLEKHARIVDKMKFYSYSRLAVFVFFAAW